MTESRLALINDGRQHTSEHGLDTQLRVRDVPHECTYKGPSPHQASRTRITIADVLWP